MVEGKILMNIKRLISISLLTLLCINIYIVNKNYLEDYTYVEEEILDIEDKPIYNTSNNTFLVFSIFPQSSYKNTYLFVINKKGKITGYKGERIDHDDVLKNYLTNITMYGENYINEEQYINLLNTANKLEGANFIKRVGFDGVDFVIIYNNKIYINSDIENPIINELIDILKEYIPIDVDIPIFK